MTLDEALRAKHLLKLVPYEGWKPCGKLTGRYFYDTATGSEDEKYLKVEVRTNWHTKEWVHLSLLQEIKEAK